MKIITDKVSGSYFALDFTLGDITLSKTHDDLVFTFVDGSSKAIQDFYSDYTKQNLPDFLVDGLRVSGSDFFAKFGEDVQPTVSDSQGGPSTPFNTLMVDLPDVAEGVAKFVPMPEQAADPDPVLVRDNLTYPLSFGTPLEILQASQNVFAEQSAKYTPDVFAEQALASKQNETTAADAFSLNPDDINVLAAVDLVTNYVTGYAGATPATRTAVIDSMARLDADIEEYTCADLFEAAYTRVRENDAPIMTDTTAATAATGEQSSIHTDLSTNSGDDRIIITNMVSGTLNLDAGDDTIIIENIASVELEDEGALTDIFMYESATEERTVGLDAHTATDDAMADATADAFARSIQSIAYNPEHLQRFESATEQIMLDFSNGELTNISGSFDDSENANITLQGMVDGAMQEHVIEFGSFDGDQLAFDFMITSLKEEFNLL